jgi:hypothetical protein
MTIDQDPAVIRAQARARTRARADLATQLHMLNVVAARVMRTPADLDAGDLVELAAELRGMAELATTAEHAAVLLGRDAGATWEQVGAGLGMARQNAQAKYGKRTRAEA